MQVITSTPSINTIGYPTCRTWSSDSRSLFIESGRPRPNGEHTPGERQLLMVDIENGGITHLAALEIEDVTPYGTAHLSISSQYHADYSPDANVLVYYDMTGHNMYLFDPASCRRSQILHEAEGTIGDPPSISADGTRVVYYVIYPQMENRFLTNKLSVIFALDVDPAALTPVGGPRIVEAYPGRKGPRYDEHEKDQVHVNHCQIDPANRDHISYAHEFHGFGVDGSLLKTRLWQAMVDGSGNRPFVRQKVGEGHTHEVFGPGGKSLYYVDFSRRCVCAADAKTSKPRVVFEAPEYLPNHVTVSPDERWIAADTWADEGTDEHGNPMSGILLADTLTGRQSIICRFPRGQKHPAHPHPSFSPDGKKIAFTIADGPHCQVAYCDISDTVGRG